MTAQALVAGIAALAAIAVAIVNYVAKRKTDRENARLMTEHDATQAQREYEYEARQRLYEQFQPVLFQLVESSESAYWRIAGLAMSAREGRLTGGKRRLRARSRTYLPSTIYRLFAPLAVLRLCQQRLTMVDLTLDHEIQRQYLAAKAVYRTWSDGSDLAGAGVRRLAYTKSEKSRQNLGLQHVEEIIECLVTLDGPSNTPRCMTYGEFTEAYYDKTSDLHPRVQCVVKMFVDFHPRTSPVLWRILITQAHLFRYLMDAPAYVDERMATDPLSALPEEDRKFFDWRTDQETSEDALDGPFSAARDYLAERIENTRRVVWQGKSEEPLKLAFGPRPVETTYILTPSTLERHDGMFGSTTEVTQYPLWAITEARVSQSLRQRARRIGTVAIDLDDGSQAGPRHMEVRDICEAGKVGALMTDLARSAQRDHVAFTPDGGAGEIP
jgi:hypothetical protein